MKLAKVRTESSPRGVFIPITSEDKPEISEEIQNKWQKIVDIATQIINVPYGIVTCLHETKLEIFLSSRTSNNKFKPK